MPQSRRNPPRKSQMKQQIHDGQVMALCTLAGRITSQPEHPDSERWESAISDLVETHLQNGQDRILSAAIAKCDDLFEGDAAEWLHTHVEVYSECVVLDEEREGNPLTAGLILIPVNFSDVSALRSNRVPAGPHLQKVGESLKAAGLIDKAARVVLGDRLYTAPELRLPWSKVLRLTEHLASPNEVPNPVPENQDITPVDASDAKQPPTEQQGEQFRIGLRFLAGVIIDDTLEQPFSLPDDRQDFEDWVDRKCRWEDAAGKMLCQALGDAYTGAFALIQGADSYYEGFRNGIAEFKMVGLHLQATKILEAAALPSTDIEAQLSLTVEENGCERIEVAFVVADTGRQLGMTSVAVHSFENRYDLMNVTMDNLESMDLRSVYFPEEDPDSL